MTDTAEGLSAKAIDEIRKRVEADVDAIFAELDKLSALYDGRLLVRSYLERSALISAGLLARNIVSIPELYTAWGRAMTDAVTREYKGKFFHEGLDGGTRQ